MSEVLYYLEEGVHTITLKIKSDGVVSLDGFSATTEYHTTGVHSFTTDGLAGPKRISSGLPVDSGLTVNQLKSICTQLDLSTSGLEQDLIDRIRDHLGL
ncbi:SAP domain-containing protein [Luminiphilus sp.]|nr:SAP domain-containing protein [Luminiphilus sp.]